jgi:hypothetical protein
MYVLAFMYAFACTWLCGVNLKSIAKYQIQFSQTQFSQVSGALESRDQYQNTVEHSVHIQTHTYTCINIHTRAFAATGSHQTVELGDCLQQNNKTHDIMT